MKIEFEWMPDTGCRMPDARCNLLQVARGFNFEDSIINAGS